MGDDGKLIKVLHTRFNSIYPKGLHKYHIPKSESSKQLRLFEDWMQL